MRKYKHKRNRNISNLLLLAFVVTIVFKGYQIIGMRIGRSTIAAMAGLVKNKIIVIDPGHGGYDPGKIGVNGTKEKDLNLQISLKLAEIFKKSGANVILTRDKDIDFLDKGSKINDSKKKRDLDHRIGIINNNKTDIYLNIQANSYGSNWTGAQTFFNENNELGKELAINIQNEIKRQLKNTKREAIKMSNKNSYMLKNIKNLPSVIIETGFISNAGEEKILNDSNYQVRMAQAIHDGVLKYLNKINEET